MTIRPVPGLPRLGRRAGTGTPGQTEPGAAAAAPGPLVAGAVLLVSGGILFAQALVTAREDGIELGGPTLAPVVVTGFWVAVAGAYLVRQLRDRAVGTAGRPRWRTSFLLLALLVGYAIVLTYTVVGYVIATAAFFFAAARVLGSSPPRRVLLRDVAVAVGLSLGIYLVFTRLLGIALPSGVLPL